MMHGMRDDLRLIIDTASAQNGGRHSLAELLAPLRHRLTQLFDMRDIESTWQVGPLDQVFLTTTQSLDLLKQANEVDIFLVSQALFARITARSAGVLRADRRSDRSGP